MKRLLVSFLVVLSLWAWPITLSLSTVPLVSSCASSPKTAYKTLAATQATVDAALKAFADARVHGKIDDATYTKVDTLYRQYQAAFATAVSAARMNLGSFTPADVTSLATGLTTTINSILK